MIDPWPSKTTAFADYILPPLMQYERPDLPLKIHGMPMWPGAWGQYTPAAVKPPASSELVNDWYVFWSIASRLGRVIHFDGSGPLNMATPPSHDEMLARRLLRGRVQLDELRNYPHGHDFPITQETVLPTKPDADARFDVMADDVAEDLRRYWQDGDRPGTLVRNGDRYTHLLASRRMRDMFNSNGRHVTTIRKRNPFNPAYFNAADLESLGLHVGDVVELRSAHGRTQAVAGVDPGLRSGVVSMAHGWGGALGDPDGFVTDGSAVNDLIDTVSAIEPVNSMPHMSGVPVNIVPVAPGVTPPVLPPLASRPRADLELTKPEGG